MPMENINMSIDESTGEFVCSENGVELWREGHVHTARIRLDVMEMVSTWAKRNDGI